MTKIVILRGYPGSGKSTWAQQYSSEIGAVIVSRDTIRMGMPGAHPAKTVLSYNEEREVTKRQESLVTAAIKAGINVVIDDTNLTKRYARRWANLAHKLGVDYEVQDFLVDVEECVARNEERAHKVPEEVIRNYAMRFPLGTWPEIEHDVEPEVFEMTMYEPDTSLPTAYIFDIDGTLALLNGRSPYAEDPKEYLNDLPNIGVISTLRAVRNWHNVILLSGRSEQFRDVTEQWIETHVGEGLPLFMRQRKDTRQDWKVKSEMFDAHVSPYYNVKGVFDDRDSVVRMWRERGITCFQVNYGDF